MAQSSEMTLREFVEQLSKLDPKITYWVAYGWVESGKVKGRKKGPFPGKTSPIYISRSEFERVKSAVEEQSEPT